MQSAGGTQSLLCFFLFLLGPARPLLMLAMLPRAMADDGLRAVVWMHVPLLVRTRECARHICFKM